MKTGILLTYDENAGEGDLIEENEFIDESHLFRADCLKDWIGLLSRMYEEELVLIGEEFDSMRSPK